MRLALLFADGNFVGREYYSALAAAGVEPALVATVGRMSEDSVAREIERTGGRWQPPGVPDRVVAARFDRTGDPALVKLLAAANIDVAIQGGIGILKGDVLTAPRIGWLNIHPGKLPQYRGNACPEWAILNDDPVVATAHLVDEGIDTGPVICDAPYEIDPKWSYHDFRANLYRHCAGLMLEAIAKLAASPRGTDVARPQPEAGAHYWPALDRQQAEAVQARFPLAR